MPDVKLLIKPINDKSKKFTIPTKATEYDFYDLYAANIEPITLMPNDRVIIPLGFSGKIDPPEYTALLFARSGNAKKHGINLGNGVGVIDSRYEGEFGVLLVNNDTISFTVTHGMRIAQMHFFKKPSVEFEIVENIDYNNESRGGGWGSTGAI